MATTLPVHILKLARKQAKQAEMQGRTSRASIHLIYMHGWLALNGIQPATPNKEQASKQATNILQIGKKNTDFRLFMF
jgi:hypothetical protein